MRVKIDECLPHDMVDVLGGMSCQAETVTDEGLAGASDEVIWQRVQGEDRFLITADLDFSDARRYTPGTHPGILLLRLRREGKTYILSYLRWLFTHYDIEEWAGCLVVATDHRVRVRRPTRPSGGASHG